MPPVRAARSRPHCSKPSRERQWDQRPISRESPRSKDHAMTFVMPWLRGYQSEWLRADVIAGLTAAAVVIPKAMAYATIAGLPLQVGLYTAFVPMAIYAVLGTSRPLSVSTTTTIAILSAAALGELAPRGDAAALIVAAGTL